MKISNCRCPGITRQGRTGIEYTKEFINIVEQRSGGIISIKDAADLLNISKSCYINREKDYFKFKKCDYD